MSRKEHKAVMGNKAPEPIGRIKFSASPYAGILCPVCLKTKISSLNQYPLCNACIKIYLGKELLEELQGYQLEIDQEEVNWRAKSPEITGKIKNKEWKAILDRWGWEVEGDLTDDETKIVTQVLKALTPNFEERIRMEKSKFKKRILVAAIGGLVITAGTVGVIMAKRQKTKEPEEEE